MATHSSILAWEIPQTGCRAWRATVHGSAKSQGLCKRLSAHTQIKCVRTILGS